MIKNKEFGSDFHYFYDAQSEKSSLFTSDEFSFFFSGRVALYNLLSMGIEKFHWKKVGFPTYYCHEVVEYCKKLPIEVIYYDLNPITNKKSPEWDDHEKNVFINVDFFGIRKLDTSFIKNSVVIDDLTHNLLSITESKADYCFGSLRKQLPLAAGGFVAIKKDEFKIEIAETEFANKTALQKLSAMYLKSSYLNENFHEKEIFRELYVRAEECFESIQTNSKLPEIIQSQLFTMNPETLIHLTRKNFKLLKSKVLISDKCEILKSADQTEMGLFLKFKTNDQRNQLRKYLIENKIYPAVLWPKQFSPENTELENTILFVHCDFRYGAEDMKYIAEIINNFNKNV